MMELGIFIIAVVIMSSIAKSSNENKKHNKQIKPNANLTAEQQKHQEIDEQITVILPTINNHKK